MKTHATLAAPSLALAGCTFSSNQVSVLDDAGEVAPDILTAVLADYEARLGALEAENAALADDRARLATVETELAEFQASAATTTWVEAQGYATTEALDSAVAGIDAALLDLELGTVGLIESDQIWTVGSTGDYATLDDALDALAVFRVIPPAEVTLELVAETHAAATSPTVIAHPDGAQLRIEGDGAGAAETVLVYADCDGVVVGAGAALGLLDNVRIEQTGTTEGSAGVRVSNGGFAQLGTVEIAGFTANGVRADWGAVVRSDALTVTDIGGNGVWASNHSAIGAAGAVVSGAASDGMEAHGGSWLTAHGSTVDGSAGNGIEARAGAHVYAEGASSSDNAGNGFHTRSGSMMMASGSVATGNTDGFEADDRTTRLADSTTACANSEYGWNASEDSYIEVSSPGSCSAGGLADNTAGPYNQTRQGHPGLIGN